MYITFLGTSSGAPTTARNVSAIALGFDQQSTLWLFDCGEGTQHQFMRSPLKLGNVERIFITHLHGDHIFGLPGLLATRSLQLASSTPITIYAPQGLENYLKTVLSLSNSHLGYDVTTVAVQKGLIYEDETLQVFCAPLEHTVAAFGYAIIEKPRAGRFKVEEASKLGIPAGPVYAKLKKGEVVTFDDGRIIDGKNLVEPPRPGRKVVYCTDTVFSQASVELAKGADVLIHEATFSKEDAATAKKGGHSTTAQAAQVALLAGVKTLIITHFSSRYEGDRGAGIEALLKEAQEVFPNTVAARDFWSYKVL
jgi:ribonuclease Z